MMVLSESPAAQSNGIFYNSLGLVLVLALFVLWGCEESVPPHAHDYAPHGHTHPYANHEHTHGYALATHTHELTELHTHFHPVTPPPRATITSIYPPNTNVATVPRDSYLPLPLGESVITIQFDNRPYDLRVINMSDTQVDIHKWRLYGTTLELTVLAPVSHKSMFAMVTWHSGGVMLKYRIAPQ